MNDKELPREPPEDIKRKQDPEYDEAKFRLDLFRVTKKATDDENVEDEITPPPSEPD